jgi:hypothetical protein
MKYNRVFRILALAVIFALLMVAIPVVPVLAAESLYVSPAKVEIDDTISVTGSDYTPGDLVYIFIASEKLSVGDDIEDLEDHDKNYYRTTDVAGLSGDPDEGDISKPIVVPDVLDDNTSVEDEEVHPGTYYVYTTYSTTGNVEARDDFIIRGIELDVSEGPVGTEVEIEGVGFDGNKAIELFYDGDEIDIADGDEDTNSKGEFTSTIIIPESTAGDHDITAEFGGEEGEAEFTVEPEITIDPTSGKIGDEVTVSGTGFGDEVDVTITFDGDDVDIVSGDEETNEDGSFEASFEVPSVGPGTYDVTVEDDDENEASAEFTIITNISLSPVTSTTSPGNVGDEITITGTGFKPSCEITITYASETIFEDTDHSETDGSFEYILTVPPSEAGAHTITASDGTNSAHATFYMESTPPPIPQPLLPYMGTKASSKTQFDWDDVTDDSLPVTYDLQVATDENFIILLLDRTGLTTSGHTLTDEEKLESISKETPYCWRVRAVDAASNASGWSGTGTFYVGFVFPELEGWVLYTVIGVGGLLLFALGFWLGFWLSRRSKVGGAEAQ